MRKYLVEFIGTFFLVFTIGQTVIGTSGPAAALAPLAIGSALMVMIYAGGHISGGHYNPAVTLAVTIRGKCSWLDAPIYMVAQVLGALGAGAVVLYLKGDVQAHPMNPDRYPAIIAEALFTFALCYVVLNTATAKATAGNSNYGLAIGFTVLTGAFAVGSISGGAFNPAVAVGITLMNLSWLKNIWIYLVSEFGAAILAGLAFRLLNPDDK